MASKLRPSLVAGLLSVVLSVANTVWIGGTARAADVAPATKPSCTNSSAVQPTDDETADGFGGSVAVNGQTALVGIPFFSTAFIDPPVPPPFINGRVAVFTCDASTQAWTRTGSIQLPATQANQSIPLGFAVALQGDLAAVGTQVEGVYVFKRQGQNWNQVVKIAPNNPDTGTTPTSFVEFGPVIAFKDDVLAIGVTDESRVSTVPNSYYVDVYQIITLGEHGAAIRIARLKPPAGDTGAFGQSLALHGDTLVVGDSPDTTAYVYKRRGFTFALEQKITGKEATTASEFGTAVAIADDVILVGAPGENPISDGNGVDSEGAVYAFRHEAGPDSRWVETQHFSPTNPPALRYAYFGGTLAVNNAGQAVIGTPRAWDFETGTEYGPTFLYTLQAGQFVLYSPQLSFGAAPAADLGMTDEYLIGGALFYQYGFQLSGAGISNLAQLPR
jgi:FG-GAP repeat